MNFIETVQSYRNQCQQALTTAQPDSAEHLAYSALLKVFEGHPTNNQISFIMALRTTATIEALDMAPQSVHEMADQAQAIALTMVEQFQKDTGHDLIHFM